METHWLGLHQLDVAPTLATPVTEMCISTPGWQGAGQYSSGDNTMVINTSHYKTSIALRLYLPKCKGIRGYCHLDSGLPVADSGEKVTSNSSSMP